VSNISLPKLEQSPRNDASSRIGMTHNFFPLLRGDFSVRCESGGAWGFGDEARTTDLRRSQPEADMPKPGCYSVDPRPVWIRLGRISKKTSVDPAREGYRP
jgi:hypothetical protein